MTNFYKNQPSESFWLKTVKSGMLPSSNPKFMLSPQDKMMMAGSCFAGRLAHALSGTENFLVTETLPPIFEFPFNFVGCQTDPRSVHNTYEYGLFTARYGNVYSVRQLLQLFSRAFGKFKPIDDCWVRQDGTFVDAFRPNINPEGYVTKKELLADREYHLRCVRDAFEQMDVLVFTGGFCEVWRSKYDGAVYPLYPMSFNQREDAYEFCTLYCSEIIADFDEFCALLKSVNPKAKIILTVSPVPLLATARDEHVVTASIATKSTLRAAFMEIADKHESVSYFPSYDFTMASAYTGYRYFDSTDCRTFIAVDEIMDFFMDTYFHERPKNIIEISEPSSGVQEICDNFLNLSEQHAGTV
jgi:hypothetical protein